MHSQCCAPRNGLLAIKLIPFIPAHLSRVSGKSRTSCAVGLERTVSRRGGISASLYFDLLSIQLI